MMVFLALIGFSGWLFFRNQTPSHKEQEIRNKILADPRILVENLSEQDLTNLLENFRRAKEQIVKTDFDSPQALHEIATIKKQLGDFEGAVLAWEYLGEIRPKSSLSFFHLGLLYHYELPDKTKAETKYLTALANDPKDIEIIRNLFEFYFRVLGDKAKAEALLSKSLEENPKSAELYVIGGNFYAHLGQKEKALDFYNKHLELNPNNGAVEKEVERLASELAQ